MSPPIKSEDIYQNGELNGASIAPLRLMLLILHQL